MTRPFSIISVLDRRHGMGEVRKRSIKFGVQLLKPRSQISSRGKVRPKSRWLVKCVHVLTSYTR